MRKGGDVIGSSSTVSSLAICSTGLAKHGWTHRELGISTVELARRPNLAQPTVSQSVDRGQGIAVEKRLTLLSK
jgi:hypothetical protein